MAREKGTTIHPIGVTLKGVDFLFRADFPQQLAGILLKLAHLSLSKTQGTRLA